MTRQQLQAYCRRQRGAEERELGAPSNILVYSVGPRNFAWFKTSDPERWRFSLKVSPDRFLELTDMPGVKPARYMARFRWITIVNVEMFPPGDLRELVNWSYQQALRALPRRQRHALGLE